MKTEIIRLKDINDKENLYLRLTNAAGEKHHINIGNKTAEAIEKLLEKDKANPTK